MLIVMQINTNLICLEKRPSDQGSIPSRWTRRIPPYRVVHCWPLSRLPGYRWQRSAIKFML